MIAIAQVAPIAGQELGTHPLCFAALNGQCLARENRRNRIIPLWNKLGAAIVHLKELFRLEESRFEELANDNAGLHPRNAIASQHG